MAFARRMLAGDICKEALALQGLPVPSAISTNTNDVSARQIWAQLRSQGRRLAKPTMTHRWQALTRQWQLTTVPGQSRYTMPADCLGFEDLASWNKSSSFPMVGPATTQQWQCLVARSFGANTFGVVYRIIEDQLELYTTPTQAQNLLIAYSSRSWVQLVTGSTPGNPVYADAPVEDGDTVMLDPEMMVTAVQMGFMQAKGFDTTAISALLDKLIETAIDVDTDAPILNAATATGTPLLTTQFNVPDTGYGG